jgi:hypothetical protein
MEKETFQKGIAYMAAAFDTGLNRERLAVYWDQIAGMRDDLFMEVCRTVVAHDQWFPTVARLREIYQDTLRRERLRPVARLEVREPGPEVREWVRSQVRRLREALR